MKLNQSEQDHQAEMDARTLTEAQEIRNDKDRYRRAKKKLKEQTRESHQAAKNEGVKINIKPGR